MTSGPTKAYIDRIRYITNTSSGALGARIVEALVEAGIQIIHIYGEGSQQPNIRNHRLIKSFKVVTVNDVITCVRDVCARNKISAVVHAMAVLDYVPESGIETKKASKENYWDIRLVRTPKVISIICELLPGAYKIGFKLEAGVTEAELIRRVGVLKG